MQNLAPPRERRPALLPEPARARSEQPTSPTGRDGAIQAQWPTSLV